MENTKKITSLLNTAETAKKISEVKSSLEIISREAEKLEKFGFKIKVSWPEIDIGFDCSEANKRMKEMAAIILSSSQSPES